MTHYLEGYVRARQTLAELERRAPWNDPVSGQPEARAVERWREHVSAAVRQVAALRPTTAIRTRLSRA